MTNYRQYTRIKRSFNLDFDDLFWMFIIPEQWIVYQRTVNVRKTNSTCILDLTNQGWLYCDNGTSLIRDPARIETLNEFEPRLSSSKSRCVHGWSRIVADERQYISIRTGKISLSTSKRSALVCWHSDRLISSSKTSFPIFIVKKIQKSSQIYSNIVKIKNGYTFEKLFSHQWDATGCLLKLVMNKIYCI